MRFVRSSLLNRDLSVLGFGAAAVLGRAGRRESLAALTTAMDVGINVFDTARSYGYGESEALLGEFLQGRRHQVLISTKFGIVPARQVLWKQAAKPVARLLMRFMPGLRNSIRSQAGTELHPGQFTVATLQDSVATSLKKLRTDYLDVLFMHEASQEAVENHELLRAMEDLVKAGKVRMLGVSADLPIVAQALKTQTIHAVQFACHLGNNFASALPQVPLTRNILRFGNHPFGGVQGAHRIRSMLADITYAQSLTPELRDKLSATHQPVSEVILHCALTGSDIVLATMMKPEHLRANAAAVSQTCFEPAEMLVLRNWLTAKADTRS